MIQEFSSDGVAASPIIDVAPEGADLGEPILLIHGFASSHRINWVDPQWVSTLAKAGRRVIALDNRGHGKSEKPHEPADYRLRDDGARRGESARPSRDPEGGRDGLFDGRAYLVLSGAEHPARVRALILGGLGAHLLDSVGLPIRIAEAMEAPSLESLTDPPAAAFSAPLPSRTGATSRRSPPACAARARH